MANTNVPVPVGHFTLQLTHDELMDVRQALAELDSRLEASQAVTMGATPEWMSLYRRRRALLRLINRVGRP